MFDILQDKKEKQKPKIKLGNLVWTADVKKVVSKGDSTNLFYQIYTNTQRINDIIPTYRINYSPK